MVFRATSRFRRLSLALKTFTCLPTNQSDDAVGTYYGRSHLRTVRVREIQMSMAQRALGYLTDLRNYY